MGFGFNVGPELEFSFSSATKKATPLQSLLMPADISILILMTQVKTAAVIFALLLKIWVMRLRRLTTRLLNHSMR